MKISRHKKILELIKDNVVTTQEELASLLIDSNYIVTQATVSRDIRELGLTKMSVAGGPQKYVAVENNVKNINDKLIEILKAGYVSMDRAQNILVIKTVSGMAMAVAAALDALKMNAIVGSIAGDDTIMCAIRTNDDVEIVMDELRKIVGVN
jgi:transcriptional regulator of arginine metabolism